MKGLVEYRGLINGIANRELDKWGTSIFREIYGHDKSIDELANLAARDGYRIFINRTVHDTDKCYIHHEFIMVDKDKNIISKMVLMHDVVMRRK